MAVPSVIAGAWLGFFFVMWATARDDSEKSWHQWLVGVPTLLGTLFYSYALANNIKIPLDNALVLSGAFGGGLLAYFLQEARYKRT